LGAGNRSRIDPREFELRKLAVECPGGGSPDVYSFSGIDGIREGRNAADAS